MLSALPARRVRSVVVVDHGSRDHTSQVARDRGAVVLRESGGYGAACRRAIVHLETLPRAPDAVAFVDPAGRADPAALPALLEPLEAGMELALAVAGPGAAPDRLAVGLIGVLYRHQFAGVDAFRAIRFPALVALGLSDRGTGWNVEMQVKALRLGLKIAEVPVAARADAGDRRARGRLATTGRSLFQILRHATAR